jgi:hypothetical protein
LRQGVRVEKSNEEEKQQRSLENSLHSGMLGEIERERSDSDKKIIVMNV